MHQSGKTILCHNNRIDELSVYNVSGVEVKYLIMKVNLCALFKQHSNSACVTLQGGPHKRCATMLANMRSGRDNTSVTSYLMLTSDDATSIPNTQMNLIIGHVKEGYIIFV